MNRRISALMSVYNGETYLAEALDSMLAELGADDEVIVVDDGSTDGTAAVLATYAGRITVLPQDNRGQAAALNRAIAVARGEFFAFNDADDLWEPGRVARLLQALRGDDPPDLAFGMSFQFVSPEITGTERQRFAPPVEILPGEGFGCLMTRASTFHRVGPLDETMRVTASYDWFGRVKSMGRTSVVLPDIVSRRRLHPANWTRLNRKELEADSLKALRAQILRSRAAGQGGTGAT